jgi:hypothetical protein
MDDSGCPVIRASLYRGYSLTIGKDENQNTEK